MPSTPISNQKSSEREDRFPDGGVVEIQVGLVRVKTMPVVGLGDRIPAPVGGLEILEDDPGVLVLLRVVAPDVKVALRAAGRRVPRALEPGMLVRGVVDDQLGDHPDAVIVGCFEKLLEVVERAVMGMNARVVGNVVAVVFQRRRVEGQEPDRRDPQVLQVVAASGSGLGSRRCRRPRCRRRPGRGPRR